MKKIRNLNYALIVLLYCLLFVVNYVAFSFEGIITAFLCEDTLNFDSVESEQARKGARKQALTIAENGITLLKNENNVLPLKDNKLVVFGWGGCENGFQFQGGGSGEGSTVERMDLYTGLESEGFQLYQPLVDYYESIEFRHKKEAEVNKYFKVYEPEISDELFSSATTFSKNL